LKSVSEMYYIPVRRHCDGVTWRKPGTSRGLLP
jgi:hypothetical protein